MIRIVSLFLAAAALAALVALLVRSALHRPYDPPAGADGAQQSAPTGPDPHAGQAVAPAAADPHAGHAAPAAADPHAAPRGTTGGAAVNSICAICGMDVDPGIPTATFRDQAIGFACMKCPPLFASDPERYGPVYLRSGSLKPGASLEKVAP